MGARFPDLRDLRLLSEGERDVLQSLSRACADLRGEWDSARALNGRLAIQVDLLEDSITSGPAAHHCRAVRAAHVAAAAYERTIGEIAWHCASAAVVVGITIWDRLTSGRPPLRARTLESLAHNEPTVGQLRQAFSGPYTRLMAFRCEGPWRSSGLEPDELLGLLEAAAFNVTHTASNSHDLEQSAAATFRLAAASPPDIDAFWADLLPPVLHLAQAVPFAIAQRRTPRS
ncbi:hypothetical protein [Streptomyces sp. H39-S7]|uniref:hypothetical protein n=1 Tax=Streptomyces sp. H39-S7 TaxID=3004357 RepID=UPI0022AF1F1A|nr:hypothetical protein [Streptomyces sp. H39-S7]MCZ4123791.1 hypothetical protein [Streptomyces sp. H39-S7]